MRPVIRTVIFDIDGTMYDYDACDPIATGAVQEYCREKLGIGRDRFYQSLSVAGRVVQQRIGYRCASVHNRLLRYQCMMELWETPLFPHVQTMHRIYWNTMLDRMKPFPGLAEWMASLKEKGIRIGVGTNMTAELQYRKLERLGVSAYVDWIVSSEEAGVEKPDAKFFAQCREKSGMDPEECLFIGDSLKGDVVPALACGMRAVLFAPEAPEAAGGQICRAVRETDGGREKDWHKAVDAEGRTYGVVSSFEDLCRAGIS